MFNLRKYSKQNSVQNYETALDDQRENSEKVPPSYNGLLDSVRKNKENELPTTTEGSLKLNRDDEASTEMIESRLDSYKPGKDLPHRTGNDSHDQMPMSLLQEVSHKDKEKAYKNISVKDKETEFWDTFITSKDVKPTPSQLHNHPDRFKHLSEGDVLKNKGVKDMIMASLKDADAMLYHIYRQAASEERELTDRENVLVAGITKDKINAVNILFTNG